MFDPYINSSVLMFLTLLNVMNDHYSSLTMNIIKSDSDMKILDVCYVDSHSHS